MTLNEKYPITFLHEEAWDNTWHWFNINIGSVLVRYNPYMGIYHIVFQNAKNPVLQGFTTEKANIALEVFNKFALYGQWSLNCKGVSQ